MNVEMAKNANREADDGLAKRFGPTGTQWIDCNANHVAMGEGCWNLWFTLNSNPGQNQVADAGTNRDPLGSYIYYGDGSSGDRCGVAFRDGSGSFIKSHTWGELAIAVSQSWNKCWLHNDVWASSRGVWGDDHTQQICVCWPENVRSCT